MSVQIYGLVSPGRRRSMQAGAAAAATTVLGAGTTAPSAFAGDLPRVRVAPFVQSLPPIRVKEPVPSLSPPTGEAAAVGEATRNPHQHWSVPGKLYEITVRPAQHRFHPDLAPATIWGYDGVFPGPVFVERYGVSNVTRIHNAIPSNAPGPGVPQISTHLHNLHCGSGSDGHPADFYPKKGTTAAFRDHHWSNRYAGFTDPRYAPNGDPREGLGTLWYHDHTLFYTAPNVYRGLAGFYLLFDHIDTGSETTGLKLPSGVGQYDIPLMVTDPRFDSGGNLLYDEFEDDGHLGNVFCVNGVAYPKMTVATRKYRFRLLNASLARFYEFYLCTADGTVVPFDYIANDGNLLPAPLKNERKVALAPAERADIVVDFKGRINTKLYLVNRLIQDDGRGPAGPFVNPRGADGLLTKPGVQIMRFDIDVDVADDPSQVPAALRPMPEVNLREVVRERTFEFDRENEIWTVNGKIFDEHNPPSVRIKRGTAEIWRLKGKGSWHHPVHIHLEESVILSRNGRQPPPHERGRKDVFVLHPGEDVRIYTRFRDHTGLYVMHCHNLTHEDHDMMVGFEVVP